jgi:hypothetical protein
MATGKELDQDYLEAKKYLEQFELRDAAEERDYAAQWMGNSHGYQRALNDVLEQLKASNQALLQMSMDYQYLKKLVREKDKSFKTPVVGQA